MTDKPSRASDVNACALCGGEIVSETGTCKRCGSAASGVGRCPQCQAISAIEPSKDLYWKCSVCGSARLVPTKLEGSSEVQLNLRNATRSHRLSKFTTPLAYATSLVFLVGFVLAFVIKGLAQPSDAAAAAIFAFPALMLIVSVFGFSQSSRLKKRRDLTLKQAYKAAIVQLMASSGASSTPTDIAKLFGIEPSRSERLLAELNVRDDITSEVTDDGQIVYSSAALPSRAPMTEPLTERLRVPEEPGAQVGNDAPSQVHGADVKTMLSSVEKP